MSSLLPEILFCILENVYTPSAPNYKLFKACALVCRAWSGPAQSVLFRCAIWLDIMNIHKFHAALLSSEARGRALSGCVRILHISFSTISSFGRELGLSTGTTSNESCCLGLVKILQACPQVSELKLSSNSRLVLGVNQETLEELRAVGQGVTVLTLACYEGCRPNTFLYLMRMWPNIRFLKIVYSKYMPWRTTVSPALQSNGDATEELAHWQRNGAQFSLYHLILSRYINPVTLTWMLASSSESLRILELQESPNQTERNILARHAPRLRSLRIASYNHDTVALVRMCTALEELVLYSFKASSSCPLAPNLPPTIEHLSLIFGMGRYDYTALYAVIDMVGALPNLKVLSFSENMWQPKCKKCARILAHESATVCRMEDEYREYEMLEQRCKMKGIQVVILDQDRAWNAPLLR